MCIVKEMIQKRQQEIDKLTDMIETKKRILLRSPEGILAGQLKPDIAELEEQRDIKNKEILILKQTK